MDKIFYYFAGLLIVVLVIGGIWVLMGQDNEVKNGEQNGVNASQMSFFITSVNPGRGGDLGGLSGADNYCQNLANSVGAGNRTWRAYLSTTATGTQQAVNARERIGNGPWVNAKGEKIANNLQELHSNNNLNKQTGLNEKGQEVTGRGDQPNWHDILTGSNPQGMAIATSTDTTCGNWTKSTGGSAMVGHHDRLGLSDDEASKSWNSSHLSRGCSLNELATTGSGGLLYCFAQ